MGKREHGTWDVLLMILALTALTTLALVCAYRAWERPPESGREKLPQLQPAEEPAGAETLARPAAERDSLPAGEAIPTGRRDGVYTILLVGNDDGNGNTDTLILGRIDTKQHRMDFVSIPRDTLINEPWPVRKINAVYWGDRVDGGDGITALKRQIARLCGFTPDCYAVADLELLARAVDCIGGVRFNVPIAMDYEDKSQDLRIHLEPGEQVLDGEAAVGLCRFRSGYVMGDLGRIEMQQQFLRACADQFLSLGSIPRATQLVSLLAEGLDTDLSGANLAFFLRHFLACKEEDIHFYTAPCVPETVSGYSYVVLDLEPWLEMLNSSLNPYDSPLGPEHLDLVYRSGDGFAGTAGLRDADYYRTGSESVSVPTGATETWDGSASASSAAAERGGGPAILVIEP